MRKVFHVFLGALFAVSLGALLLQGFGIPRLPGIADLALRLLAAVSCQWLLCRTGRTGLIRALPLLCTAIFSVWGFFLFLTSPSWQHATFGGFLTDYLSPTLACGLTWWLCNRR